MVIRGITNADLMNVTVEGHIAAPSNACGCELASDIRDYIVISPSQATVANVDGIRDVIMPILRT